MKVQSFRVVLQVDHIAGGYPSNLDAYRTFLQHPMRARAVPAAARQEFEEQFLDQGLTIGEDGTSVDPVVRTGFAMQKVEGIDTPVIMNYQIKAMLQGAADSLYDKSSSKGSPSTYQVKPAITHALEVRPAVIPIIGGVLEDKPWLVSQIISHPRNPNTKVPSTRERRIVRGGRLTFTIHILATGGRGPVLIPILGDLLYAGGQFVGLGTDRGYNHGRFEPVELTDLGVVEYTLSAVENNPNRRGMGYVRKTTKQQTA